MANPLFFVDMHCHPALKPFGQSYPNNINSENINDKSCIWHYDPPNWWDKLRNRVLTVTKFSQSNFSALAKGNIKIINASLAPIEKGFFVSRFGSGNVIDCILNFVTEVGTKKVDFIQGNNDYFSELLNEYCFYKQLDGKVFTVKNRDFQYKLTTNNDDILNNLNNQVKTISVVFSIEGGHVFNEHANRRAESKEIIDRVKKVKQWKHRPLFVSLTHHFYNEFGGHAESLSKLVGFAVTQKYGLDTELTGLGREVLDELLDNTDKNRIYIDVKHMSRKVRQEFYNILGTDKYKNEDIPIIVSHGAVNGYDSVYDDENSTSEENGIFFGKDINFFNDELVKIAESKGLFCLQLDDRRVASKTEAKKVKILMPKRKKLKLRSKFIWNQIQHIAEVLDEKGLCSWDTTVIGSDFDGIVDPPNGFWTSEDFPLLYKYLKDHAEDYIQNKNNTLKVEKNKNIEPEAILNRLFTQNAMNFLSKYYVGSGEIDPCY